MVTGRSFQQFSSDQARHLLTSLVEEDVREDFDKVLLGLCAIVKVINSQKRKVNVDKLRELSTEVNLKLVSCFPWVVITPSVHRIMCHSWERIQMNDSFGLGDVSEEGLEALNKNIRQMKEHGARKVTTEDNFRDCYNHLWDRSRPTIVEMDRIIKRKDPKVISFNSASRFLGISDITISQVVIATEIESLVESLFMEEASSE